MENMSKDPVEDIKKHLDKAADPILVILRSHLLVEERLRDILAQISRDPEELKAARLSFHQALYLCRAVIGRRDDAVWDFMARLNEVRNRISHHLEPGDFDLLLGSMTEKLRKDYAAQLTTPHDRFRSAIFYTCGYLEALKGSAHLRQAYDFEGGI